MLLTISVLVSLKGRAVTVTPPAPASPPQTKGKVSLQRLSSSLHPDDRESRASELFCVAFRSHNLYK